MNNMRRKRIDAVAKAIRRVAETLEDIRTEIGEIRDDEQEAYDNLPEGVQEGERGDAMVAAIDHMEEAIALIEDMDTEAIADELAAAAE